MFNRVEFEVAMLRKGANRQDLAKAIGVSYATLMRKIEKDGDFDREQISKIMTYLGIDDPNPIFFCERTCARCKRG